MVTLTPTHRLPYGSLAEAEVGVAGLNLDQGRIEPQVDVAAGNVSLSPMWPATARLPAGVATTVAPGASVGPTAPYGGLPVSDVPVAPQAAKATVRAATARPRRTNNVGIDISAPIAGELRISAAVRQLRMDRSQIDRNERRGRSPLGNRSARAAPRSGTMVRWPHAQRRSSRHPRPSPPPGGRSWWSPRPAACSRSSFAAQRQRCGRSSIDGWARTSRSSSPRLPVRRAAPCAGLVQALGATLAGE